MTELMVQGVDLAAAPLTEIEAFIGQRMRGFVETGRALLAVRERQLYYEAGFDDFDSYCRQRWELGKSHAYQLTQAAEVVLQVSAVAEDGRTPQNEAQARALAPLLSKPEELREVWQQAVDRSDGQPTAAVIREVIRGRKPRPEREPDEEPPGGEFPHAARRIFMVVSQAMQEVHDLGGVDELRTGAESVDDEVREIWRQQLKEAAETCTNLALACRGV